MVNNVVIQGDGRAAPVKGEAIQADVSGFNLIGGDYYSQQHFCEEGEGKTSHLLQEGEQLVKKIGGVFAFDVKDGPGGATARWVVDVKSGQGSVSVNSGMCGCCCPLIHMRRGPHSPLSPSTKGKKTSTAIDLCVCC